MLCRKQRTCSRPGLPFRITFHITHTWPPQTHAHATQQEKEKAEKDEKAAEAEKSEAEQHEEEVKIEKAAEAEREKEEVAAAVAQEEAAKAVADKRNEKRLLGNEVWLCHVFCYWPMSPRCFHF